MVINLQGLDKYEIKHTGSRTNIREKTSITYEQKRTDGRTDGRTGNI